MTSIMALSREEQVETDGRFRSLADFLCAVKRSVIDGAHDARLIRAPSGNNETDPAGGGFTVPSGLAEPIVGSMYDASVIAPLCDVVEMAGPFADIKQPGFDETSRADGSRFGGTLGYWAAEANSVPLSKPRWRNIEWSGKKLVVLVYASAELFSDAALLESHFRSAMQAEGAFLVDAAIVRGDGVGKPLGIINAPCTIQVPKAPGQKGATIIADNVSAMWSRLPVASRRRAVWLVNEDAEAQLSVLDASLYLPQGRGGNAFPLLKGRPVIAIEQASPLGQTGDIVLADLQQYRVLQAPPAFALSAEVSFLTDELAFRFVLRVDGAPLYSSPVLPSNGANVTRAPFVTLAARQST